MASTWLSIAVGAGSGAVKGWTVTSAGRVGCRISRQLVVIVGVALGFIRRMFILVLGVVIVNIAVEWVEGWV